jgi:DNA-binding GntR family transcriptional regulator
MQTRKFMKAALLRSSQAGDNGRVPLRTDLRRKVLERILNGKLSPGVRVNESRLAKELRVSRTPLREALFQLEREGFVRSDRDRGFSVEPISAREIRELYPMLWTLECLALRLCGPRATLAVPSLNRLNNQLRTTRKPKRALILDNRWHEALLGSCPNRRLQDAIQGLRLAIWRYELLYMRELPLVNVSVHQHQEIIKAVKDGDTALALEKLEENWRFSMEELLVRVGEP